MANDIIRDDEWEMEDEYTASLPPKEKRSGGGGGHTGLRDYVIVALIAIIAVMGINNYLYARTGTGAGSAILSGGSGGGGCCGGGGAGGAVAASTDEQEQLAVAFYVETTGDEDIDSVQATVEDFGCHQEIYIYKDGELVMRVGYASGEIYQLS